MEAHDPLVRGIRCHRDVVCNAFDPSPHATGTAIHICPYPIWSIQAATPSFRCRWRSVLRCGVIAGDLCALWRTVDVIRTFDSFQSVSKCREHVADRAAIFKVGTICKYNGACSWSDERSSSLSDIMWSGDYCSHWIKRARFRFFRI